MFARHADDATPPLLFFFRCLIYATEDADAIFHFFSPLRRFSPSFSPPRATLILMLFRCRSIFLFISLMPPPCRCLLLIFAAAAVCYVVDSHSCRQRAFTARCRIYASIIADTLLITLFFVIFAFDKIFTLSYNNILHEHEYAAIFFRFSLLISLRFSPLFSPPLLFASRFSPLLLITFSLRFSMML